MYAFILIVLLLFFFKFAVSKATDPYHPSRREHPCKDMINNMKKQHS